MKFDDKKYSSTAHIALYNIFFLKQVHSKKSTRPMTER